MLTAASFGHSPKLETTQVFINWLMDEHAEFHYTAAHYPAMKSRYWLYAVTWIHIQIIILEGKTQPRKKKKPPYSVVSLTEHCRQGKTIKIEI